MVNDMMGLMKTGLLGKNDLFNNDSLLLITLASNLVNAFWVFVPFFLLLCVVSVFSSIAVGGWSFNLSAFTPDFSRLNPFAGIARMFSYRALTDLIKSLIKFVLIISVSLLVVWNYLPQILALDSEYVVYGINHGGDILLSSFIWSAASLILVAMIDVPYQLWSHSQKLRMTKQEVKDEYKESEGKPEVRARIRRLRQEYARSRMLTMLKNADVVITNPSHYAVALRYQQDKDTTPVVVAKGVELIASQIRQRALLEGIPIVQIPTLARSIYHSTRLNQKIPSGLYLAVAKVLAYVYRLKLSEPGKNSGLKPPSENDIYIPPELRV
jgi:flagellar biosynthesis protein FlhB